MFYFDLSELKWLPVNILPTAKDCYICQLFDELNSDDNMNGTLIQWPYYYKYAWH